MKRKHASAENSFDKCRGVGIADSTVRLLLKKLDVPQERSTNRSHSKRYPELIECISVTELDGCEVVITDLEAYLQHVAASPVFLSYIENYLNAEAEKSPLREVDGLIYIDEVTPGNVIQPDNERRAYCCYFCWKALAHLRKDLLWLPLALLRHSVVDEVEGGLTRVFKHIVEFLKPFLSSCIIAGKVYMTKQLWLLADEAALKYVSSAKGASGMRPCLRCDAISRERDGLAGYHSICESDASKFTLSTQDDVLEALVYLQNQKDSGASNAAMQRFEKITGFNCEPHCWILDGELRQWLPWGHLLYDPMHVYWSNGVAGQEISLFVQSAMTKCDLERSQLEDFLTWGWNQSSQIGGSTSPAALKKLISPKLLKKDVDYRGDADDCLRLLPLLAYFAETLLQPLFPTLQAEIKS